MLVLSRKKKESIYINGEIKVTILDVSGDTIKLGIEAPKNIEIYRSEVFEAIKLENKQAVKSEVPSLADLSSFWDGKGGK